MIARAHLVTVVRVDDPGLQFQVGIGNFSFCPKLPDRLFGPPHSNV